MARHRFLNGAINDWDREVTIYPDGTEVPCRRSRTLEPVRPWPSLSNQTKDR